MNEKQIIPHTHSNWYTQKCADFAYFFLGKVRNGLFSMGGFAELRTCIVMRNYVLIYIVKEMNVNEKYGMSRSWHA